MLRHVTHLRVRMSFVPHFQGKRQAHGNGYCEVVQ
jgi:hypothetical protein